MVHRFLFVPVLIFCFFSDFEANAQFSVETRFHFAPSGTAEEPQMGNHQDLSVHYWTRLKNVRIEFQPGILYQHYFSSDFSPHALGITVPTHFYILDMLNDCDCPTFSKNDYLVEKGFFVRLAPSFLRPFADDELWSNPGILEGELGIGLDIGLSDLITITPLLEYKQQFYLNSELPSTGFVNLGVSMLFRTDYRRRYR